MIVTNWLLYSSFYGAYGYTLDQYPTFEERIKSLLGISILFFVVNGLFLLPLYQLAPIRR